MNQQRFTIPNALTLEMQLEKPRFGLNPTSLFALAARQNTKRAFLFVSKVLGKHMPIHPAALLAAGKLLALTLTQQEDGAYWADIVHAGTIPPFATVWSRLERTRQPVAECERTLFVGFAETATGLARAVAECFSGDIAYIDTTRLEDMTTPSIGFSEEHSHAKTHKLYLAPDEPFMAQCKRIVLIDDEMTTGKTALRLVRKLHAAYGVEHFVLMTILDCSLEDERIALEREMGIRIEMLSLLRGQIGSVQAQALEAPALPDLRDTEGVAYNNIQQVSETPCAARALLSESTMRAQSTLCECCARSLPKGETLYLGTGELIFVPALIAGLHGGTHFHSTTQSPVYPLSGSAITNGAHFDAVDCYSPTGYLYNVPENTYHQAILFSERTTLRTQGLSQLTAWLHSRGIRDVSVVAL